ncbi:hypothetical protein, partial [Pseudomonas aeruginosa]
MDFLPLFHSLQGRLALVVGGGEAASYAHLRAHETLMNLV